MAIHPDRRIVSSIAVTVGRFRLHPGLDGSCGELCGACLFGAGGWQRQGSGDVAPAHEFVVARVFVRNDHGTLREVVAERRGDSRNTFSIPNFDVVARDPEGAEAFAKTITAEQARWKAVIDANNIRAE